MTHYQKPQDLLTVPHFASLAPTEAKAFLAFNHTCERDDGEIPRKYRELISIAVALTTQCAYCLDVHTKAAAKAGATRRRNRRNRHDRRRRPRRRDIGSCVDGVEVV